MLAGGLQECKELLQGGFEFFNFFAFVKRALNGTFCIPARYNEAKSLVCCKCNQRNFMNTMPVISRRKILKKSLDFDRQHH